MQIQERIRKFDADCFGFCRPSVVVSLCMDAMLEDLAARGLDRRSMLEKYGAVWMAAHFKYSLSRPLLAGELLQFRPVPATAANAHVQTETDLYVQDLFVGRATAAWILTDVQERRILRPGKIPGLDSLEEAPKGSFQRGILPPEDAPVYKRMVHYSDCDVNGHLNSARYADCVCDAYWMEKFPSGFVSELQLSFSAESKPWDVLEIRTWRENGRFMAHAACGDKARFSACFKYMYQTRMP